MKKQQPLSFKRLLCLKKYRDQIISRSIRAKILSRKLARVRLYLFFSAIILVILFQNLKVEGIVWLLVFGILIFTFVTITVFHSRLKKRIKRNRLWARFIEYDIARINLDWDTLPEPVGEYRSRNALEDDLQLSDDYSLMRLIDLSISHQGTELLRKWLVDPELSPEVIIPRQILVEQLKNMTAFRRKLILSVKDVSLHKFNVAHFLKWLHEKKNKTIPPIILWVLIILAPLNILLIVLAGMGIVPDFWIISLILYGGLLLTFRSRAGSLIRDTENLEDEVRTTGAVFSFLEKYPYPENSELSRLCVVYRQSHKRPTLIYKRVNRAIDMVGFRRNPLAGLILNLVMPYDLICGRIIRECKHELRENLPQWMDVLHQLEGLISLANFAYLNPGYHFPEIGTSKAFLTEQGIMAKQLGHPLILSGQKVCNDFEVRQGKILLITGSNMSGKSTFLKTVGINLALAYAGAPVNADEMTCGLFRLRTCIRVVDSLEEGFSFFYAEVKRLKSILNALDDEDGIPIFFLIDEIFKGTNNRERLIGSENYIRELASRKATGLITTHDLELVQLENQWDNIRNYHFSDRLDEGKLIFDYRMKTGPCRSTNALKIMESEGIPIQGRINK